VNCDPDTLVPELNTDTFETNVPNLFVAGGAVAGRHTGNIFIENGRFHGAKIIDALAQRVRDYRSVKETPIGRPPSADVA
jgi:thioredoxin reductase (NADPH)